MAVSHKKGSTSIKPLKAEPLKVKTLKVKNMMVTSFENKKLGMFIAPGEIFEVPEKHLNDKPLNHALKLGLLKQIG